MELILLTIALGLLFSAGVGLHLLIHPRATTLELLGYSFPLGCALISIASFVLSFRLRGAPLLASVAAVSLLTGISGIFRRMRYAAAPNPEKVDGRWLGVAAFQVAFLSWLSCRRPLGWDGLLIFELKARLAFLGGGAVPVEYYNDEFRRWTHPSYPLLLPLTENWLYLWMGVSDQQLVKILFPLFLLSLLALLYVFTVRAGTSVLFVPLLFLTMPFFWFGIGSLSTGYSDLPLGVFYLGAILGLLDYNRRGMLSSLLVAGLMLAGGCFLKREGVVLWSFALLIGTAVVFADRRASLPHRLMHWFLLFLPGLAVFLGWRIHLWRIGATLEVEYLPLTIATLTANRARLPILLLEVGRELVRWEYWGIFWLLALVALGAAAARRKYAILAFSLCGPFLAYCAVYIFSAWVDWQSQFQTSFSRLLLQLTPVTSLLIAEAAAGERREFLGKTDENATN